MWWFYLYSNLCFTFSPEIDASDFISATSAFCYLEKEMLIILGWIWKQINDRLPNQTDAAKTISLFTISPYLVISTCLYTNQNLNYIGIPHQLHRFALRSWRHSSFQNNAYAQGTETPSCHVSYARNEGTSFLKTFIQILNKVDHQTYDLLNPMLTSYNHF